MKEPTNHDQTADEGNHKTNDTYDRAKKFFSFRVCWRGEEEEIKEFIGISLELGILFE